MYLGNLFHPLTGCIGQGTTTDAVKANTPLHALTGCTRRIATQSGAWGLVLLIALTGAILRFSGLDNQSLWNDELSTWHNTAVPTVFEIRVPVDNAPGYFVFQHYWQRWVGTSETALRFPAAVAGWLAVPALFLLGRRLYAAREGLIACGLLAVAHCAVYYSQEARPYSFLLTGSIVSTLLLLDVVAAVTARHALSRWKTGAYVCLAAVMAYLNYFGLLLIALQSIAATVVVLVRRTSVRPLILIYGATAIAYSPWIPAMWQRAGLGVSHYGETRLSAFPYFLSFACNQSHKLTWLGFGLLCWLAFHASTADRRRPVLQRDLFVFLWAVGPLIVGYLAGRLWLPILSDRNFMVCVAAVYLLFARAIVSLPFPAQVNNGLGTLLVSLFLVHLLFALDYYRTPAKDQFREAVNAVVERSTAAHDTVVLGWAYSASYFNYYFDRLGAAQRVDLLAGLPEHIPRVEQVLCERQPQEVWFLRGYRKPDPAFLEWLQMRLHQVEHRSFFRADAYRFVAQAVVDQATLSFPCPQE